MRFDVHQNYSTELVYAALGATSAGVFERQAALALTAVARIIL